MYALRPDFELDFRRLRAARLAKVQTEMTQRNIGALVLTNPINIRYATDVSVMPIWTAINLARYAVIPPEGEPILFEYGKALFRATALWPKSRAIRAWQYRFSQHTVEEASRRFAEEIRGLLAEWGARDARVGIDTLDCNGFLALQAAGVPLVDADEALEVARLLKTPDEIALIARSCAVAECALADMESTIRPGVTENQLLGTFWGKMQALGGEHCSTRLVVSGEKTNPWFYEAGDRLVRPGDLVAIDTDMVGPHGYLCDISRTFLCGDRASADQVEAYQVAHDYIQATIDLCRPGIEYGELLERAPRVPEGYREQGYSCLIHGDGMDDEPPFVPYPHELDRCLVPRGRLQEGMVLSVEFYAGKKGRRDGVKLEEQILVTEAGPVLLSTYPFDRKLLGRGA